MNNRAMVYTKSLGRAQVTGKQKHVLVTIASYYSERYNSANVGHDDLCNDTLLSDRQLRRVLLKLQGAGLLEYLPGRGAGNFSQFRFPHMPRPVAKPVEIDSKRGHKEDTKRTSGLSVIRKDLNPNQIPIPPSPPLKRGALTGRQIQSLRAEIQSLMSPRIEPISGLTLGPAETDDIVEATRIACERLLLPLADALVVIERAGHGKAPRSVAS
jgi:hypothetical protein